MMPILILAAGASSRMRGRDKLLMEVAGQPLIENRVQMALAVSDDVRVALPPEPHARHGHVQDPAQKVSVPDASEGIAASLRRLFATLAPDTPHALVLLADLPEITADDLRTVIDATRSHPNATVWRGATEDGKPGHPLIIGHPLFPAFRALTGDAGGQHILAAHTHKPHLVRLPAQRARLDLDTPEDWAAWRAANADA